METLILYAVIPRRINFLQMGRYGTSCEQRFRQNFSKDFDWMKSNLFLSERILTGNRKAIAIDSCYISKSGKCTPLIGYFRSGTAGQAKIGLEILVVGLIDVDNKDCISLQAVQTPDNQTPESNDVNLIDWYLPVLKSMKYKLQSASPYVVADAYFSKANFAAGLKEMDFHLISRFRDAKGFTGLMQSQARDVAKLSFNFNASLTSVNLAKVPAKQRGIPFSMASCKTMIHNAYLLNDLFACPA